MSDHDFFAITQWQNKWRWGDFFASRQGVMTMVTALLILPLIGASLLAFEAINHLQVQTRLDQASGVTSLVGAKYGRYSEPEAAKFQSKLRRIFTFNNQGAGVTAHLAPADKGSPNWVESPAGQNFVTRFLDNYRPLYTPLLGDSFTQPVEASHEVSAQANWKPRKVEYALILDESGSFTTDTTKNQEIKPSLEETIKLLFDGRQTANDVWVSVIGFAQHVNVGRQYADRLVTPQSRAVPRKYQIHGYTDYLADNGPEGKRDGACLARKPVTESTREIYLQEIGYPPPKPDEGFQLQVNTDTKGKRKRDPNIYTLWQIPEYTPNPEYAKWDRKYVYHFQKRGKDHKLAVGTYDGCGFPMVVAANRKADILDRLEKYLIPSVFGATVVDEGLVWGYRALSPQWREIWETGRKPPAPGVPARFDDREVDKKLIFFYDAKGLGRIGYSNPDAEPYLFNDICTYIKDRGIELTVIIYEAGPVAYERNLRDCASPGRYFQVTHEQSVSDIIKEHVLPGREYKVALRR